MQKSPSPYIHHIIDSAAQVREYIDGVSVEEFQDNRMIQDAVIRQLEIIGEALWQTRVQFQAVET